MQHDRDKGIGNMHSRKLSLTLAKKYRTCPPPEVRDDPNQHQEYGQHLRICPYCSDPDSAERDAWETLGRNLTDLSKEKGQQPVKEQKVAAGQLRFVRHDLVGWRDALFYNPPMVLVLEKSLAISDDVLVSQTYPDVSMAGPGDLILMDRQTRVGGLFVECWNTYTLKGADLGERLGYVDTEIIDEVKSLEMNPDIYPAWAMIPKPFAVHDPRIYFRELEVEVGYAFSSRSVSELMAELEAPPLRLVYDSAQGLQEAMRKALPGTRWKRAPTSREEVLALADLPIERLPLAASDRKEQRTSVNLVRIKGGEVTAIDPVALEIHGQSGTLTLSGRIADLPGDLRNSRFICFLDLERRDPLSPVRHEWDEATGDFLIEFNYSEDVKWRLRAAVVFEPDND